MDFSSTGVRCPGMGDSSSGSRLRDYVVVHVRLISLLNLVCAAMDFISAC